MLRTRTSGSASQPWYVMGLMIVGGLFLVAGIVLAVMRFTGVFSGVIGGSGQVLAYTTEAGAEATEGTVDSPLRATFRVPGADGTFETALAGVTFQLLDESGKPARIGDGPGDPDPMKPALEIGVWYYDGSIPSEPGTYHAQVEMEPLSSGVTKTMVLTTPLLLAKPETAAPLASGFVYSSNSNLWLLSTDTSRQRRLTFYPSFYENAISPAWSPNGKSIAYSYQPRMTPDQPPATDIWAVGPDGKGAHALAKHGSDEQLGDPVWSADGKSVYFSVETSNFSTDTTALTVTMAIPWRIDQVDVSTGHRSTLVKDSYMPSTDAVKDMAYLQISTSDSPEVQGKPQLVRVDAASKSTILVKDGTFPSLFAPRLSPDGKWVAFAAISNRPSGGAQFDFFKWLLMEPKVAYAHGLPWELFVVPAMGGTVTQLTALNEDQPEAAWLDNDTIAFMGTTGLYKVKLGTDGKPVGQPQKIHDGAPHGGLTWHAP